MAVTKKRAFERWVQKSFRRRDQQEANEKKRFQRERFLRTWFEWFSLETTHHALVPVAASLVLSGFAGWSMGVSSVICPSYLMPAEQSRVR